MLKFKQFVEHINELTQNPVSGTKAGWTTQLDHKTYQLKSDVKGARIGQFVNVVLPKGTIIHNLPGGVFAFHKDLKDKYCTGWKSERWDNKYGVLITSIAEVLGSIEKSSKILESVEFLNEGGNAVEDARPITQAEIDATYAYVIKTVYPLLGLSEDFAKPIGSFKKKAPDQTSGDIDIAVLAERVAGQNGLAMDEVLDFIDATLRGAGYTPSTNKGLQQCSIGVPVEGKKNNGIAQIDLMLTDNLDFSTFMYHSPDFTKAESKYKGLYRNILLMNIISNSKRETTKLTDKGEVQEYKSYVLRLNQGVVSVAKTFLGKKGNIVKTASLLHDQDKFITNTPEVIAELAFGPDVPVSELMTFEDIWRHTTSSKFIHKDKLDSILNDFKVRILATKVPFPSECVEQYPNIFN
jgi:hypothetical protein